MSNENVYADPPGNPAPSKATSNNVGIILLVVAIVAIVFMVLCAGILAALLLPAVSATRHAARRMQCSNNLKQISLALQNYESTHGSLPPAYTVDKSGKRLHSWRALILPFLEEQGLYQQIDFDKPWDDPVNLPLRIAEVPAFSCPSSQLPPDMTTYVAVVDPQGMFAGPAGIRFDQVVDGLSQTVMVTECDVASAVPWMSPQDMDLQEFVDLATAQQPHTGGGLCGFGDGSVKFLSDESDPEIRRTLVIRNDGKGRFSELDY